MSTELSPLAWDSGHFGFPVARILGTDLSDEALDSTLGRAQALGIRLLYWAAPPQRAVPNALLQRWAGRLVDSKITFRTQLDALPACGAVASRCGTFAIIEYPIGLPTSDLVELAIAAGKWSRYRNDPRVPVEQFEGLYERWIRASTSRELADMVLVARDDAGLCVGLITIASRGCFAEIGLLAVSALWRGRGVGSALMHGAHEWVRAVGGTAVQVVTQLANEPACRLYRRNNYVQMDLNHVYHFWPCTSP